MTFFNVYECIDYMNANIHNDNTLLEFISTKHWKGWKGYDYSRNLIGGTKYGEYINMTEVYEIGMKYNLFNNGYILINQT